MFTDIAAGLVVCNMCV